MILAVFGAFQVCFVRFRVCLYFRWYLTAIVEIECVFLALWWLLEGWVGRIMGDGIQLGPRKLSKGASKGMRILDIGVSKSLGCAQPASRPLGMARCLRDSWQDIPRDLYQVSWLSGPLEDSSVRSLANICANERPIADDEPPPSMWTWCSPITITLWSDSMRPL